MKIGKDGLFKSLVYKSGVSLTMIDGGEFCAEGLRLQKFEGEKANFFCEALLCTAFMSANLKEETGEISVTFKTNGRIQNATVSGNSRLQIRGCADEGEDTSDLALTGNGGFLQVVRNDGYSVPFTGACALVCPDDSCGESFVAKNVCEYFRMSEQLPTYVVTTADSKAGIFVCAALQALPGCGTAWEEDAKERLSRVIKAYLSRGDFLAAAREVFGETTCEEYREPTYRCNCSREYLTDVLRSMGKEATDELFEKEGEIRVHCHYCNTDYVFFRSDLQ